jgi:hypothetical protein
MTAAAAHWNLDLSSDFTRNNDPIDMAELNPNPLE